MSLAAAVSDIFARVYIASDGFLVLGDGGGGFQKDSLTYIYLPKYITYGCCLRESLAAGAWGIDKGTGLGHICPMPRHATYLHQHPEWEEFFRAAEILGPGETVELISAFPGRLGSQEIAACRAWIAAERKRRIEEIATAMLADPRIDNSALDQADPLKGVFTAKEACGDRWKLVVARKDWGQARRIGPAGKSDSLWDGPPECEYEPEEIPGGQDDTD